MIVFDTNVVSEFMRPQPDPAFLAWSNAQVRSERATTAITIAEVLYGVERLPEGKRKLRLRTSATEVFDAFAGQVFDFDRAAAFRYGELVATREREGRPIGGPDAQIASICLARGATLATRNVKGFADLGVEVVDPWATV